MVEFFDIVAKRKRLVFVYSPYEELKIFGLKFDHKKKKGYINGYPIQMKEENNKIYLEKELFFNKIFFLDKLIEESDNKNVIFFKYNGEIYALKLKRTKAYYEKLKKDDNQNFQSFIYKMLFPTSTTIYKFFIEKIKSFQSNRYPILINDDHFTVLENVDIYLSSELFARNKSFLRSFTETGEVNVTSTMLNRFRRNLNDQNIQYLKFTVLKRNLPRLW